MSNKFRLKQCPLCGSDKVRRCSIGGCNGWVGCDVCKCASPYSKWQGSRHSDVLSNEISEINNELSVSKRVLSSLFKDRVK